MWPLGLYQGVVWEENPKLMFLGMQDQFYTFNMFDAQAWYVRDVILGRIKLPSKKSMQEDSLAWRKREEKIESAEHAIYFQGDYVKHLIGMTDYPNFDIDAVNKTFLEWEQHKMNDIMTFRDNSYRSVITGNISPLHHTPWSKALDDSLKTYLEI